MSIGYGGWYNIYEGKKVSTVTMCEVRFRKKQPKTKTFPKKKSTMMSNKTK
jgi:hypothetical protein